MTCRNLNCTYCSARYEPFNFLTAPIPEDSYVSVTAILISLNLSNSVECKVKIKKPGNLFDIIKQFKEIHFCDDDITCAIDNMLFVAAELSNLRIRSFIALDRNIETIKENESIIFYQVRKLASNGKLPINLIDESSNNSNDINVRSNSIQN
jgi:hypothetical protein